MSPRFRAAVSLQMTHTLRLQSFSPKIEKQSTLGVPWCTILAWEKHSKKISELMDSNTSIDMEVRDRLAEMTNEIADKDTAVSLKFLKEHLHLQKDDDDAIEELKFHVGLEEGLRYSVIKDDSDQSVYVYFTRKEG